MPYVFTDRRFTPCRSFSKSRCAQMKACQWIEEMDSCHDLYDNLKLENEKPSLEDTQTRHATTELDPTSQEPMLKTALPEDTRSLHASDNEGSKQNEENQTKYMNMIRTEKLFSLICKNIPENDCRKKEGCVWSPSKNECVNQAIEAVRDEAIKQDERFKKTERPRHNAQTAPAQSKEEGQRIVQEILSDHEKGMERLAYNAKQQRIADTQFWKDALVQPPKIQATRGKADAASKEEALWVRYQKNCPKPRNTQLNPTAVATWEAKFEKYKENYRSRPLTQIENHTKQFS